MKITKIGHSCLVVGEGDLRILFDPGSYTKAQNDIKDIDLILLTQEHGDHLDLESLKKVLANSPQAKIFTNSGVGKILDENKISYGILEHGSQEALQGVTIEAFGEKHAPIYSTVEPVINTGYLVAGRFFHPGDAFTIPNKAVEILALPVAGPWLKISEANDYAKAIHPKVCFPIHDGMLKFGGPFHAVPQKALEQVGIKFIIPEEGKVMEF